MERKIYTFESFLIKECGKGDKPECKEDDEKCEECGKKECTCGDEEAEDNKDAKKYKL